MAKKLTRWIFFSVLISICPLCAAYLISQTMGLKVELSSFISRGELQLISVALLATGIGELIGSKEIATIAKIIVGGIAISLSFIMAMWFGAISSKLIIEGISAVHQTGTEIYAILSFLSAIVVGGSCVVLSEV